MEGFVKKLLDVKPGDAWVEHPFAVPPAELSDAIAQAIERLLPPGTWIYSARLIVNASVLIPPAPAVPVKAKKI